MDKTLTLCGLGTKAPDETTVETLQALEAARVVYCDASEDVREWLKPWCKKLVPASLADAATILKDSAKGGVAVAVWGHPVISSPLGRALLSQGRKKKLTVKVLAACSPLGSAFARAVAFLGGDYGYHAIQACETSLFAAGEFPVTADQPVVLYSPTDADRAAWPAAVARLQKQFGKVGAPEHDTLLVLPKGKDA